MSIQSPMRRFGLGWVVLLGCACLLPGCQKQQSSKEDGKVYTSDKGGSAQGGATTSSNQKQDETQTLNSPADTISTHASQASDNGSTQAADGQVVTNPGAPNARDAKGQGQPAKKSKPAPQ